MNYLKVYEDVFYNEKDYNVGELNTNYKLPLEYFEKVKDNFIDHIDISSGRGGFLLELRKFPKINSKFTDIKKFNDLNIPFMKLDLTNEQDLISIQKNRCDVLTCLDVLEHLELRYVDRALEVFSKMSRTCILTIASHEDIVKGHRLHLIIEDLSFWKSMLSKYFILNRSESLREGRLFYFELSSKNSLEDTER